MYPTVSPLLWMMVLQYFNIITCADAANVYYIKPTKKSQNCPSPCLLFEHCLRQPNQCFKSNSVLHFLPGKYVLNHGLMISNINNISLLVMYNQTAVFSCTRKESHISFKNSTTVNMSNFAFKRCGAKFTSIMSFAAFTVTFRKMLASTMVLYNCSLFQLSNVAYENSHGHGLIIINARKVSAVNNMTFSHSRYLEDENIIFVGMLVYFEKLSSYQINLQAKPVSLLLQNSQFMNYDGFTENPHRTTDYASVARALNLIIHDQNVNITLIIVNSTFTNCTCFEGPLIKVSYSYYGLTQVYFKETRILGNMGNKNVAVHVRQSFQGEKILLINNTQYYGHKVQFEKLHMHGNRMFTYMMQFDFTADRRTFSRYKAELLPFNLYITESNFTSNGATTGLWNFNFDSRTNITLLVTVTIRNCHFVSNENMLIGFYNTRTIIFCGQNIFKNNTVYSSLMIIDKSDSYFSGVTKFVGNNINGSSVMTIGSYTNLLLNASLHFESNNLISIQYPPRVNLALIHNKIKVFNREPVYYPCTIQFRNSHRENLSVEFSDFSLTFENNTANNHEAKILYGKNFRDCFWLPDTPYPDKHPSELFKSVIQYNGNDANPSGYPYNLCVCQESINCIEDRFFDDGVYPGQMLNISFILVDTGSKETMINLSVDPVKDVVEAVPCNVEHSEIRQLLTTKCSAVIYTLSVINKSITECSLQLQYVVELPILNIYYVRVLPCPPGFIFTNQKCQCHPALQYVTSYPVCYINNQSVYRPANSWLSFSEERNEILYVEICPFQHCLPRDSFIQLLHPDVQCRYGRTGVLCGKCSSGLSSVFGSLKCKKCSNVWLAFILLFAVAGLLLVLLLFLSKTSIKDGNINGFVLYVNILSINSYNIFASDSNITTSFAYILTSLANLDLGFDLCFYDGMTEYNKTWLQLAFPLYLLCLAELIIQISRHIHKLSRLTGKNTISVLATLFLLSYNKILLISCRGLFFYSKVTSLESRKKEILWSIDINVPLFGVKFFCLFILCLVLLVAIIIPLNLTLLLPKTSYRIKYVNYFKPLLDVYHGAFKDNHRYWFGLELILRVVIFGVTALDSKISLLLNVLILAGVVAYLCFIQPFNNLKNSLLEWSFLMNAIVLLMFTFYYGKNKTEMYFRLLNFLIVMAFVEFIGIILSYPFLNLSKSVIRFCREKFKIFHNYKNKEYEMNPYQNLNIPEVTYNYTEFQEELLADT